MQVDIHIHMKLKDFPEGYSLDKLQDNLEKCINDTISLELPVGKCIRFDEVENIVINYFDFVTHENLKQKTKRGEISVARHVCMYMIKKYSSHTLGIIGEHYGGRDHSSVSQALKALKERLDVDKAFVRLVNSIEADLKKVLYERQNKSLPSIRVSNERHLQEV